MNLIYSLFRYFDIRSHDPLHGSPRQLKGFDGIRALAFLLIFAFHVWYINGKKNLSFSIVENMNIDVTWLFSQGHMGVPLFFILSGFLLALPFFKVLEDGLPLPCIYSYLRKRFLRIVPAYYVAILFFILFYPFIRCGGCSKTFWLQLLTHLSFTHTFMEQTMTGIAGPLWAVGVEVHFYLVLPGVMWLFFQFGRKRSWPVLLAVLAISSYLTLTMPGLIRGVAKVLALDESIVKQSGRVAIWNILHLFSFFYIGVIAAWFYRLLNNKKSSYVDLLGKVGSVVFASLFLAYLCMPEVHVWLEARHLVRSSYGWPVAPWIFGAFILSISLQRNFLNRVLEWAPLKVVGLMSYGMYLYHMTILHAVRRHIPNVRTHLVEWVIISFVVTYFLAFLSYRYIEIPFLRRKGYSLQKKGTFLETG